MHRRKTLLVVAALAAGIAAAALAVIVFSPASGGTPGAGANLASAYESATTTLRYGVPIRVERVIDGDTVVLEGGAHLRYIGMDTPEEFKPNTPVQCYAKEAADENRALVEGKLVTIYKDVSAVDIYGRYLGFLYLPDGTFVNEKLVADGAAFAYPYKPDTSKKAVFAAAQAAARAAGAGLWGACKPYQESNGRWQTNPVQ